MDFYWLALGTLGTWRLTHLIAMEDGPFAVIQRLRRLAGGGVLAQMLDCFYCLSMWSAALVAFPLAQSALHYVYLSLALSAGSIFLECVAHRRGDPAPACEKPPALDRPANEDVLLREIEIRDGKGGAFHHAHGFGD
ncbi:MAG: hypothetical protein HXY18_17545 [Bryobacteraceae bacterium]|nr:hypothetical protein [Bryobacteraceae bacterium]